MVESQKEPYVLVIGDINVDILASAEESLAEGKTLHGRVESSLGGVGRNVAWNLRKLEIPVVFLTTVGTDLYGPKAIEEAKELGVDISHAKILDDEHSSSVLYLEDKEGEVCVGLKDIHSLKPISVEYLQEKASLIQEAPLCMVSGNLPVNFGFISH